MLQSTYSYPLVFVSLLIATMAAYTALEFANRIVPIRRSMARFPWLAGGAMAMGMGIWSMHFVGMLAFSLPIALGYDLMLTGASLAVAVIVSFFAISLMSHESLSWRKLCVSGILLGSGISTMHYTGMAAMKMEPGIQYHSGLFLLSVAIAIGASIAAILISSSLRTGIKKNKGLWRTAAAVIMGIAITGMHYTGMAAANFPLGSVCGAANGINPNWLALSIIVTTMSVMAIALVLSVLDSRLEARTGAFNDTLRVANEKLQFQATHDALTGLPNRILLTERIQHAIDSAERAGDRFALYFIDLDGFKTINDTLGHSTGDAVLKEVSRRLKASIRKEDIAARLGGDEFVVMVSNLPDVSMAAHIAEKLFECFREEFTLLDTRMRISPSIGISLYPDNGDSMDALLRNADAAMYEVKTNGRNNYLFFEPSMNVATLRTIEIQRSMPQAMKRGQFFIMYQPKFACDGTILGAEALLRWQHPALGAISPAEFIPIAERSGQITEIGYWVIEQVCRQLRDWTALGLHVKVAVNLSQIQLRAPNLVQDIIDLTSRHDVRPQSLMFEITESVAMHNAEETMKTIEQLQNAGFDLAIDDFGTGYSSLSYLQQFAVRQLKVDRTFVDKLSRDDSKALSVVAAIISLAHSLNMEVVAEGVETDDQYDILRELECDQIQGYLMARPMRDKDFLALLGGQESKVA